MKKFDVYLRQIDRDRVKVDREYHATIWDFIPELWYEEGEYERVAQVEAEDPEEVWEKCNSIHGPWYENEGVDFLAPVKNSNTARSMSIGDVCVDLDTDTVYMADRIGFKEIPKRVDEGITLDLKANFLKEEEQNTLYVKTEEGVIGDWVIHEDGLEGIFETDYSLSEFKKLLAKQGEAPFSYKINTEDKDGE